MHRQLISNEAEYDQANCTEAAWDLGKRRAVHLSQREWSTIVLLESQAGSWSVRLTMHISYVSVFTMKASDMSYKTGN